MVSHSSNMGVLTLILLPMFIGVCSAATSPYKSVHVALLRGMNVVPPFVTTATGRGLKERASHLRSFMDFRRLANKTPGPHIGTATALVMNDTHAMVQLNISRVRGLTKATLSSGKKGSNG